MGRRFDFELLDDQGRIRGSVSVDDTQTAQRALASILTALRFNKIPDGWSIRNMAR